MAFSFISYWNYGSRYCGIEYGSNPDGSIAISAITAVKKKDEFEVEKTFRATNAVECAEKLINNQHAFLCITSNQVLIKATASTGPVTKVVSSAFPNVDLNEFYFEILPTSTGNIVALCRREQVQDIINSLEEQKIRIIGFSLGFSSISNFLGILNKKSLSFSSYKIISEEKIITSFERAINDEGDLTYTIGDTEIKSQFLLPLSAIFNYNASRIPMESNLDTKNLELKKEHHQKVFFQKGLATVVTLLLVLLLINFIGFSSYYSQLQQMTGEYEAEISQKQVYELKFQKVVEKEKIVENIIDNSNSRSSFYLNRIITGKPASVLLHELTFQPLQKPVKDNEPISLELNGIRMAGESNNENEFSLWIKAMEEISWIKEVKVSDFGYSSPGTSEFLLTLKFIEDEAIN